MTSGRAGWRCWWLRLWTSPQPSFFCTTRTIYRSRSCWFITALSSCWRPSRALRAPTDTAPTRCLRPKHPRACPGHCESELAHPPASPAGLTTQVGFIRLGHLRCPNLGKPKFGWSILSQDAFCEEDGLHETRACPSFAILE